MKVSKRERTLLVIVLMLALVSAYYLLFLKPYLSEMSELNIELANSETQAQTYAQLKVNIDNIDAQIEQKRSEIDEFSHEIDAGFDQPPVLVYLEDTVGKHGQKNMFNFGLSEQVGQMIISPVTITMVTTYDGLKGFISDVTEGEYIIKITSIEAMVSAPMENTNEQVDTADGAGDGTTDGTTTDGTTDGTTTDGTTTDGTTDGTTEDITVPVTVPAGEKTEGMIMVENSDQLLKVSIEIEIYGMFGDIPQDKVYNFKDGTYTYGGDIFY